MKSDSNEENGRQELPVAITSPTILSTPHELDAFVNREHNAISGRVSNMEETCRGALARFITRRGLARVIQENNIAEVTDWHKFRRELFKLGTDSALERLHEAALRMCRSTKVEARQEFGIFVMERQQEFRDVAHAKRASFLDAIDAQYALAERYSHRPVLVERAIASIEREIEEFSDWLDGLSKNFLSIAEEGVNTYRRMS